MDSKLTPYEQHLNTNEEFADEGQAAERNVEVQERVQLEYLEEEEPFRGRYAYFMFIVGVLIINTLVYAAFVAFENSSFLVTMSSWLTIVLAIIDSIVFCRQKSRHSYACSAPPKYFGFTMSILMFFSAMAGIVGAFQQLNFSYYFWVKPFYFFLTTLPKILISYDWLKYYVYNDHEGIFGINVTPLKCVIAITFNLSGILCWPTYIFLAGDFTPQLDETSWWIEMTFVVNAIISTLILFCSIFLTCSKRVHGSRIEGYWAYNVVKILSVVFLFGAIAVMLMIAILVKIESEGASISESYVYVLLALAFVYLSYVIPVFWAMCRMKKYNSSNIGAIEGHIALQAQ